MSSILWANDTVAQLAIYDALYIKHANRIVVCVIFAAIAVDVATTSVAVVVAVVASVFTVIHYCSMFIMCQFRDAIDVDAGAGDWWLPLRPNDV